MNFLRFQHRALVALTSGVLVSASIKAGAADDPVAQFEREVKPLLEERCFKCHGPDKQKGGLRLDIKTGILEGGDSEEAAVVPGNSGASPLIKRVLATEAEEVMPPKGERLDPAQVAILTRWIDLGAHWSASQVANGDAEPHASAAIGDHDREFWAFQSPQRSAPALTGDAAWCRQPLDRFILARLRERGLTPSDEAARAILIRRMAFDLTGLPPTPGEVDAFLADTRPDACDRLADRLRVAAFW